jgi:hypothetical protein
MTDNDSTWVVDCKLAWPFRTVRGNVTFGLLVGTIAVAANSGGIWYHDGIPHQSLTELALVVVLLYAMTIMMGCSAGMICRNHRYANTWRVLGKGMCQDVYPIPDADGRLRGSRVDLDGEYLTVDDTYVFFVGRRYHISVNRLGRIKVDELQR